MPVKKVKLNFLGISVETRARRFVSVLALMWSSEINNYKINIGVSLKYHTYCHLC